MEVEENNMSEEIIRIDPDFDTIIKKCTEQLEIKFTAYRNTWLELDDAYYKERLFKEVDEYVKSMTVESERRKLLNIINIAAMAWETAKANRAERRIPVICTICGGSLVNHKMKDGFFICK